MAKSNTDVQQTDNAAETKNIANEELLSVKKELEKAQDTLKKLEEEIELKNKKIEELEINVSKLNQDITDLQNAELFEHGNLNEIKVFDDSNEAIKYKIKGTDITAFVDGILPAGQSSAYLKTSVILKIKGERITISEELAKEILYIPEDDKKIEKVGE